MEKKKRINPNLPIIIFTILIIIMTAVLIIISLSEKKVKKEYTNSENVELEEVKNLNREEETESESDNVNSVEASSTQTGAEGTNQKETVVQKIPTITRVDASYEKRLAGAMLSALPMMYRNFEIQKICYISETDPSNKMESNGVYLLVTIDGQEKVICSTPLEDERTQSGTIDMKEQSLGFATYDLKSKSEIDTEPMKEYKMEEVTDQISESLLVTIYEH